MDYQSFVGGSYESQAWTADAEETINLFYERMESQGATTRACLYPTPGVEEIDAATTSPGRAHLFQDNDEFAVFGTSFCEVHQDGLITVRGTVAISSSPATISSNGDGGGQLFITSGNNGYCYDLGTNVFTQITALNGKATMGDYIDGYFLALDGATSTLYISDLLDGLTWDPTQFAQRSTGSDPWRSMRVNGLYIWLFGTQTSEVWYDAGTSPFPFARHPSGFVPYGISAPFSVAVADGQIMWLGGSRIGDAFVLRAAGFSPEVVSDYPRQRIFAGYAIRGDAVAECINYMGHIFYLLTFPFEDITWAFDVLEGKWTRWATWISEESKFVAWRPRWHAMAFGEHRMLDASTGALYRMAQGLGLDVDGREIVRERRAPCLTDENNRIFYPGFELDLEPGLGAVTGQGSDPQVMMTTSDDGGKTWSNERWASVGALGQYSKRVRWNRCGSSRRRVFKVRFSDPIPYRITNAYLTPDPYPLQQQQRRRTA